MPENHTTGEKGDEKQRARRMDRRRGKPALLGFTLAIVEILFFR